MRTPPQGLRNSICPHVPTIAILARLPFPTRLQPGIDPFSDGTCFDCATRKSRAAPGHDVVTLREKAIAATMLNVSGTLSADHGLLTPCIPKQKWLEP